MAGAAVLEGLRKVPLFARLEEGKLAWIRSQGEEMRLDAGTRIAAQGDPPDGFYVILEGETEWTRRVGDADVHAVTLGEGDVFAELIMVLDAPYPTTGTALTDLRLFKLGAPAFWEMLKLCPEVLKGVLATSAERAQIHESVSQRAAKLISLGTMAAGLAHELNNPAAAVVRSADDARETLREASARAVELGALDLSPEQRVLVAGLPEEVAHRAEHAPVVDALERGDLEDEIYLWLEDRGVEEAWDLSPALAQAGLDVGWLEGLAGRLPEGALGGVLAWLVAAVTGDELLREARQGAARISELVGAVKSYSHLGKAPLKEVDVHEGLESTLLILGHKLKKGNVEVRREYAEGLPPVRAHAGELNQVWTNLIDNAIDAVDGEGRVTIRTARENDRVLVEVSDDGPGIPEGLQDRVFEPFFTTKDVGSGTGIGLDVSRRVVVEEHKGDLRVESEPGETRFQVRLPIRPPHEEDRRG